MTMKLETFFLYMLGALDPAEADQAEQMVKDPSNQQLVSRVGDVWQKLNEVRARKQAQTLVQAEVEIEQKLERIIRWVAGEATAEEAALAKIDATQNERCQAFHTELTGLKESLDRYTPPTVAEAKNLVRANQAQREPLRFQPLFSGMLPAWRSGQSEGSAEVELNLPLDEEFGFSMSLLIPQAEGEDREIHGEVLLPSGLVPENVIGAKVWLMSAEQREQRGWVQWKEQEVSEMGTFMFGKVTAGQYVLEMAWPQHFMESDPIEVPAS